MSPARPARVAGGEAGKCQGLLGLDLAWTGDGPIVALFMLGALLLVLAVGATAQAGESKAYKAEKKAGKDRICQICGFSAPRVPNQILIAIARADVATLRDGPLCSTLDQIRQDQHDANMAAWAGAFLSLSRPRPPAVVVVVPAH